MAHDMVRSPLLGKAQDEWLDLRFGLFACYNINTFYGRGWTDGTCDPAAVNPRQFDPEQWAAAAKAAGMRYAVFVAKHHDGFCIWPTRKTDYNIAASPFKQDMLAGMVSAFQDAGLKTGLYYSLWDRHEPSYPDDDAYTRLVKDQLTELLSDYGPMVEIMFDGAWDKGNYNWFDLRRWHWEELYDHIKSLQPNCLVMNNPTGAHRGELLTWPVDLNMVECVHFIVNGTELEPDLRPCRGIGMVGRTVEEVTWPLVHLPVETCDVMGGKWFYTYGPAGPRYRPPETIREWLYTARRYGGNLLLSVPPAPEGRIDAQACNILSQVGKMLAADDAKRTTMQSET